MNRFLAFSLLTFHFSPVVPLFADTRPASAPATTQAIDPVPESAPAPTPSEAVHIATTEPSTIPATEPAIMPATAPTTRMAATRPSTRPAGQPNILLICTDDQSFGQCGFEGGKVVTPHLDRLAKQSIHFTRCYVPTPQCAPTQASMITGQFPHTHGLLHDGLPLRRFSDTVSARLRREGYAGGFIGQWQLGQTKDESPGFGLIDFTATNAAPLTPESWNSVDVRIKGTPGKSDKFLTEWQAERAIDCIQEFQDRPFFVWLNFNAPHEPLVYPPDTESLYSAATIELPLIVPPNLQFWPSKMQQLATFQRYRQFDRASLSDHRARYFAMIAHLDEQIGRVLKELDELHLAANTWVIFTSDSGFSFGEHTLFGKGPTFFEQMVRVPLLVRPPQTEFAGEKTERVVSLVDLAPTLCEAAGLNVPITMQGRSLMPLVNDPSKPTWTDEAFFEYDKYVGAEPQAVMDAKMRGIIALHFKFVDYLDDTDMFFDLKRDPDELTNAVAAPHYMGVSKVLRDRLNQWRAETRDPIPVVPGQ